MNFLWPCFSCFVETSHMKKLLLLLSLALSAADAPSAGAATPLRERLENHNREFSEAFVDEDLAAIMDNYADSAMLMPEHSTARYGKDSIENYYRQWFAGAAMGGSRKTIHEALDYGDYAVETGNFVHTFTKRGSQPYDYAGKYMVVWAVDGDRVRIVSELWGANAPFGDAVLPEIEDAVPVADRVFSNDAKLAQEIGGRNALIGRLVTERKGAEHADLFLPDAIYMTYYTPMLVGIENIRPYFIEH